MNIDYACFLNYTGFGYAARNYIRALAPNHNIRVISIGKSISKAITIKYFDLFKSLENKKQRKDSLLILHCIPDMFRRIRENGRRMAVATFEAQNPPERWITKLNALEGILTPSKFNQQIFSSVTVPNYYFPHCLDFTEYNLNVKPLYNFDKFTFLFSGTWQQRKGYEILLQAFYEEFNTKEAILVIKTNDKIKAQSDVNRLFKKKLDNIIFISDLLLDEQLPSFYKSFNCLVSPTLGEGFGLPGLQCLGVGVPVIITDYSGVKDYVNENNSYLLRVEGFFSPAKNPLDSYYQFSNQQWPFVSVKQLKEKMRYVYENYNEAKEKVVIGHEEVSRKFNYEVIREMFKNLEGE